MTEIAPDIRDYWLAKFDADTTMEFLEKDNGIYILTCLKRTRGLAVARKVTRQIIAKNKLFSLLTGFNGNAPTSTDLDLFYLLPKQNIVFAELGKYNAQGHSFTAFISYFSAPEVARQISAMRKQMADQLKLARKRK